jgi:hypothetical protein
MTCLSPPAVAHEDRVITLAGDHAVSVLVDGYSTLAEGYLTEPAITPSTK